MNRHTRGGAPAPISIAAVSAVIRFAAIAMIAASLALSCQTKPAEIAAPAAPVPDEKLVARGRDAWNKKGPETAREHWAAIQDAGARKTYIGYVDAYEGLGKDLDAAFAAGIDEQAKFDAAFGRAQKALASFPAELKVPEETRDKAAKIAAARVRALLDARRTASARELAQSAWASYGDKFGLPAMLEEADLLLASQKSEAKADASLEKARGADEFYAKIALYEEAAASYAKVEDALAADSLKAGCSETAAVAAQAARLKKKGQDSRIEMERRLRERQYSFKDRIGEEFARVPEGDKLGTMTKEEMLAFEAEKKANIDKDYEDLRVFHEKFPTVIDSDMIAEIDAQRKALESRIARVEAEIRTAKEIASRGKPVAPLLIGLFNPQPGGKGADQKSRPAAIRGTTRGAPDYWWGMEEISKGAMNDLVVTVGDERTVRVFADNTKSGSRIGQAGVKDLVNRSYKLGNSWPVLNAGAQLPSTHYYVEVQEGKKASYEGEIVIYSSFIARQR
jgi:hypothetical protein